MRVTENTSFDTIRNSIHRSRSRMEGYQEQSSTLRKLNAPSDDPVGAAKVMEIRTDKVNNDQYQMNGKMAETFLSNSDHALSELAEILLRAKEIAIGQSSGPSSNPESRVGVAEEVAQLFLQSVATANRKVGDRYLFGGYQTLTQPVDKDGNYTGDDGKMMLEIAKDVFITTNVDGFEAFNTALKSKPAEGYDDSLSRKLASEQDKNGSPPENVNIFDELQNLRISLLTGDLEGTRATLERFDQLHSKVTAERAKVGSRLAGLQITNQALERHNVTNATLGSQLEDADMAQVMSDLAKEETIFRSSLASSKRLVQPTLLDFLK